MIKGKYVVIIVVILLIIVSGVRVYSSYHLKRELKNDTITHLITKGYKESDIDEIDVVNIGGNELQYAASVTFGDELEADYLYTYINQTNQIIQIDVVNKK